LRITKLSSLSMNLRKIPAWSTCLCYCKYASFGRFWLHCWNSSHNTKVNKHELLTKPFISYISLFHPSLPFVTRAYPHQFSTMEIIWHGTIEHIYLFYGISSDSIAKLTSIPMVQ
jgi:hypothetical protein